MILFSMVFSGAKWIIITTPPVHAVIFIAVPDVKNDVNDKEEYLINFFNLYFDEELLNCISQETKNTCCYELERSITRENIEIFWNLVFTETISRNWRWQMLLVLASFLLVNSQKDKNNFFVVILHS